MGIFDFLKGSGKEVKKGQEADEIKRAVRSALGNSVDNLFVHYQDNGTVALTGTVDSYADKQRATLIAGNIKGVEKVDDQLTVKQTATAQPAEEKANFYTIQSGDTLSKIAKQHYGDANQWRKIHEANKGIIDDPDKIYPGQSIRIPGA